MKKLAIILAVLLCASPAWAAITDSEALLSGCVSTTSTTSLSCTTAAQLDANKVGVFVVAGDNICTSGTTTDVVTNENLFTSATIDGNAMTEIAEGCSEIDASGGAGTGIMVAIYVYRATGNIALGATVVFNFTSAITSKAALGRELNVTSGNTLQLAGSAQYLAEDGGGLAAMTISGLSSKEYYFLRAFGLERDTGGTFTPTASYTSFGVANADTGVGATSVQTRGEYRILTGTGDTSDGSLSAGNDVTSIYVALEEVSTVTTRPIAPFIFQ